MPGRFIALEGPDGVGKTTLGQRLGELDYAQAVSNLGAGSREGAQRPLVFVSRRQLSATSEYAASLMHHLATVLWESGDSTDLPDSFWVATQAAWFTAHSSTVLKPLLDAGHDVIVDGWVYKFFSKLLSQGYKQHELDVIFSRVRMPDKVILLNTDIEALYTRRATKFRPSEMGMHAGYTDLGHATFVHYQELGMRNLEKFADSLGWTTLRFDADTTIEESIEAIRRAIIAVDLKSVSVVDLGHHEVLKEGVFND